MERNKIILLIFLMLPFLVSAQSLVNSGTAITIKSGSAIKIKGDYVNQQNGRIKNAGIINLDGDWIENSTAPAFLPASGGLVKITGSTPHFIGGSYYPVFPSLLLDTDVGLQTSTYISQNLALTSGKLTIGDFDLQLFQNATITNVSSNRYIITNGSGSLQMTVAGTEKWFPVGTATNYSPVSILNNNATDEFAVRVFNDVLTNGTSGISVSDLEETVKHTWVVTDPDGSMTNPDFDIHIQWNGTMEGNVFDRTKASVSTYDGSGWQFSTLTGASGSNPYFMAQNGITNLGAFTVKAKLPVDMALNLKVFLEGPFNGTGMNTELNNNPELVEGLPLSQPYNMFPWNYFEPESVSSIPNNQVVDWVLVEWRDAHDAASATESTRFARQAAFLLNNGNIVGLDGSSMLSYNYSLNNDLFVVIWHRNHLPIMSANPLTESGDTYTYDFTTSASQAYGNSQNNLGNVFGMIGGNGDANSTIDIVDKTSAWMTEAGLKGYLFGDFTMDGQVNNQDKNDVWLPNLGTTFVLP